MGKKKQAKKAGIPEEEKKKAQELLGKKEEEKWVDEVETKDEKPKVNEWNVVVKKVAFQKEGDEEEEKTKEATIDMAQSIVQPQYRQTEEKKKKKKKEKKEEKPQNPVPAPQALSAEEKKARKQEKKQRREEAKEEIKQVEASQKVKEIKRKQQIAKKDQVLVKPSNVEVEEPLGFLVYQVILLVVVISYSSYHYLPQYQVVHDNYFIPLQFFLFTFFRKDLGFKHSMTRQGLTLFVDTIGAVCNYFFALSFVLKHETVQFSVTCFIAIFGLIFVLGKDERFSINAYFKKQDHGISFAVQLICITSYAMSLVDFVRDFNSVYNLQENLGKFYLIYFTFVAYGFYVGDLIAFILTGFNFSDCFDPNDLFFAGLPYVICFPVMAFAQDYVPEPALYTFAIAVFGSVLAYIHIDSVKNLRKQKIKVKVE